MPCISDPGEDLVSLCAERNIRTIVIPGPSAAVSALAVSGLSTARFCFEGFLSTNHKNRMEHLRQIAGDRRTLIFYEAPHKLVYTLQDMLQVLGDRRIALCRELTKLHEEIIRTTFSGALALYREKSPRGEYVLIIEGAPEPEKTSLTLEDAAAQVKKLRESGLSVSDAAKQVRKDVEKQFLSRYENISIKDLTNDTVLSLRNSESNRQAVIGELRKRGYNAMVESKGGDEKGDFIMVFDEDDSVQ